MGAGIAHAFLAAGARVSVVEADETTAAAASQRVRRSLGTAVERGTLAAGLAETLARFECASDHAAFAGCDLVIEAVPELVDLKKSVLTRLEQAAPGAVLATNTSSLSVDDLATSLVDPEKFIGLHFFNPVPASDLVEVVVAATTAPELVENACSWVESLGKTAITVQDAPGFASSRLGVAIALEAMRMLESGVASAEDIDTAMTLGYKHPMGPLRTTDVVGLDVRLAIAEHLERELGPRFAPPAVLREKVAAGFLGRKTGQGFYAW